MNINPLLGHFNRLTDLFPLCFWQIAVAGSYTGPPSGLPRHRPLKGLPGTVDVSSRCRVLVAVEPNLQELLNARCLNGVVDHFRCIRSAAFMDKGLLPVYCSDGYGASFLIATVPYSEHATFANAEDA
jgi:hypothetical protein